MARVNSPVDFRQLGAGWAVKEREGGRSFAVLDKEVEVSPNDDRQYRFLTLKNGLKALLISDKTSDKAAAALGVQVGHLSDPDDLPGLAHFCEHMLFLGTERFPDEKEYKTYLSQNSGGSNAYTSLDETVYHFDCSPAGLPGALARHSQFFTAPLFDASCTDREVNAVDSEFRRNLQLDARRLFQLGKAVSSPDSVYWKFGTGSKETLWLEPREKGVDVRARLLEWYNENYSANLMSLVVLSNHSLDDLASMVVSEYSDVPNANLAVPDYPDPPITAKEGQTEVSYRTVKDTPQLRIEFGLPDLREQYATKPGRYLSHYFGHEGPGSILAELKARGWATSLSASSSNGGRGFDFMRVNVNLTATGLKHYKSVLSIFFSYVDLLKTTPPQQWAWEEMQQLGRIAWRWKEKGQPQSAVRNLASQLGEALYPLEKQLVGPWYAEKWDAQVVKDALDRLTVDNCRVFVGSKEPLEGRGFWKKTEKYYGTEYDTYPLDLAQLKAPLSPPANLALPDRNIFIPSKLELVTKEAAKEPAPRPMLTRKTATSRLWVKTDDQWLVPRGTAYFLLRSPLADHTARHAVLTQLFTSLVEEALVTYAYDATLAGLDYSLGTEATGVLLVISGYTDKLPLLLRVVLEKLKGLQVDPNMFELVHDRLVRAYKNANLNNPYQIADSHLRRLTRQTYWTWEERLEALQGLTPSDVEKHAATLLSELSIDSLVHGNFVKDEASAMLASAEEILQNKAADPADNDFHRALVLPEGSTTFYRPLVPSPENVNSAANIYYQVGAATDHEALAKLSLFAQIAKVPVFSTLRTVEQLGYIVSSSTWVINAFAGFRVILQSERTAEYLDERVDALWASFGEHLEKMTEEEFNKERESLALKKLENPKNLGQETTRFWQEVDSGELDFFYRDRQASLIRGLSKGDIAAFFERFISPSSASRTKLSILMRSQRLQPAALEPFLAAVRAAYPPEVADEAAALAASKPTLAQLDDFVGSKSTSGSSSDESVREELEKLRGPVKLPEGAKELREEEVVSFLQSLPKAEGYRPVATFDEDLQKAHL
ncbi:hypothetical protein JCM6882_007915 [Rhodosporidiobolus microsporus]